ncbi:MAG: NAD(P)/FAD-dependent oxidoreductase [Candidatus Hadarchaeales archaeon]
MEEVVIVGGGPAGLTAALSLLEEGISPLVLERSTEFGHKACGELMAEKLYGFDVGELVKGSVEKIHENLVVRFHDRELHFSGIIAPGWQTEFRFLFINRKRWESQLAKKVERKGGEIRREEVRSLGVGEGCLLLNEKLRTKFVIGADGALSLVRCFLGGKVKHFGFAVGKRISGKMVEEVEPTLIVNPLLSPSGYAWIFPGKKEANVGIGEWYGRGIGAWEAWKRFSRKLGVEEEGTRGAFIPLSLSTRTWGRRTILVGDAGGFTDPLTGGGLNAACFTGWLGGKTCARALKGGKERPEEYEKNWRRGLYPKHLRSYFLAHLFYRFLFRWKRLTPFFAKPFLKGERSLASPQG